jgi:hypothetical protein
MDVDKELLYYMHHIAEDSIFIEITMQTLNFSILAVINHVMWSSCWHGNQYSKDWNQIINVHFERKMRN